MQADDFEIVSSAVKTVAKELKVGTDELIIANANINVPVHQRVLPITLADQKYLCINPERLCFGLKEITLYSKDKKQSLLLWVMCINEPTHYSDYFSAPLFILKRKDYFKFLRIVASISAEKKHLFERPILDDDILNLVYSNTIGFLENRIEYEKFNIPIKRGLLFSGPPGNGKTSLIKWLKCLAEAKNFNTNSINLQELQRTVEYGDVSSMFVYDRPTLVFFDDVDVAFKNRKDSEDSLVSHFLTGMDGIVPVEGAVFIFTTNQSIQNIDPALTRPGRIDVNILVPEPNKELRRKFINDRFGVLRKHLSPEQEDSFIQMSEGMSFAAIESLRQEIVKKVLAHNQIDINGIFSEFKKMRGG